MPYVANWLHLVWATRERQPLLTDAIRPKLFQHMRENALVKGFPLEEINGWHEHLHILLALPPEKPLAQVVQLLKGESSHWVNAQGLTSPHRLAWQNGYWAASVSPDAVERVRGYIRRQEEHHRVKPFAEEYTDLMQRLWFVLLPREDA